MQIKRQVIIFVVGLAIGASAATFWRPAEKKQKTVSKYDHVKEKIVTKIITKPNKEVIKTVVEYRDKIRVKTKRQLSVKPAQKDWIIGVTSAVARPVPVFTVTVDRRIFGGLYLGAYGRTDREVGFGVKLSF